MRIPHGLRAVAGRSVVNPRDFFDVALYTGNGSTQTISGLGFSPNWIWFKQRNTTRENHLYDSVRGVQKALYTDLTNVEATDTDALSSFNSDGWTMGADGGSNQNGGSYVAWCWDAGEGSAVTNTQGSITSSVRANATAGFSIVTYSGTGTTPNSVGHGLNVAPKLLLFKCRNVTVNWYVWHDGGATANIARFEGLNTTAAAVNDSTTSITSSTFTFPNNSDFNASGRNYVAYCFAPVVGYSSFGSYTGNGSATGPVISGLGFEPYFVMIKASSRTGDWFMYDAVRSISNPRTDKLKANSSAAEDTAGEDVDFQSDGFQIKNTNTGLNENAATYIYAAFA